MKWNRLICAAMCICLCAAVLTGCGSSPAESTRETVVETTVPETAVPETAVPETAVPETAVPETTAPAQPEQPLFENAEDFPLEMTYSSGAGGWHTELTLNTDGTFTGSYSDSEVGESADDYPGGTLYFCNFSGSFDVIAANRDHTYTLELAVLSLENQPGQEFLEDGIRYLAAEANGLSGSAFVLGAPEADPVMLGEFAPASWPGNLQNPVPDTLSCWALYNVTEDCAFFTYD